MPPNGPPGAAPLPRRWMLRAGGVLGLAAIGGCSLSDPRIDGDPPPSSTATAQPTMTTPAPRLPGTPEPAVAAAARAEAAAGALAVAVLTDRRITLSRDRRRLVTAVRDAHRDHAAVLTSAQPVARPTGGPLPTPGAPARTASLAALVSAEQALARRHAGAVPPSRGLTALLWASLGVAATTMANALTAGTPVPIARAAARRAPPVVLEDVAGIQALVGQLHAVIYGYQVAIGRLGVGSDRRDRALAGLAERRALRDRLVTFLLAREADVPAAAPAYVPSVAVTSAGTAAALIAAMETALLPYAGQWLSSATTPRDVERAFGELNRTAGLARRWGGPVLGWPGWP